MSPEFWQTVKRLLVLCYSNDAQVLTELFPVWRSLQQALPDARIRLLVLQPQHYQFLDFNLAPETVLQSTVIHSYQDYEQLLGVIQSQSFDAAIIFTSPQQSPFALAYLCYLTNIPVRVGQSREFGGGVLSHAIQPPTDPVPTTAYNEHLLQQAGILTSNPEYRLSPTP